MAIFHCYVSSPEGTFFNESQSFFQWNHESNVFQCLPMSSNVFQCLPMSSNVFQCLPMSIHSSIVIHVIHAARRGLPSFVSSLKQLLKHYRYIHHNPINPTKPYITIITCWLNTYFWVACTVDGRNPAPVRTWFIVTNWCRMEEILHQFVHGS